MAVWYQISVMPEFYSEEVNDDSRCYRIVRLEDEKASGLQDVDEYVVEENLTKSEANRKVNELDSDAVLLD